MQIQLLRNRGGKLGVPLIANLGVFNKRVCVYVCVWDHHQWHCKDLTAMSS